MKKKKKTRFILEREKSNEMWSRACIKNGAERMMKIKVCE
jgi:hypothetical protein